MKVGIRVQRPAEVTAEPGRIQADPHLRGGDLDRVDQIAQEGLDETAPAIAQARCERPGPGGQGWKIASGDR
ncbi:hypothetical protein [Sphingomonas oleivorans]|nr:hypothetical protein [Sphingomonas oleivorans]